MSKELRSLLDDFASIASDWNKVMTWLSKLNSVIAKDISAISSEKYSLAKRLAQCLHPECPLAVHISCLEIYNIIFKSPNFIEDFALYSGGILPFFEYGSKDCKLKVLAILKENVLPKAEYLTFAFPGLVCSLLPGFRKNEEDYDIDGRIIEIFAGIAHKDKQGLYGAVWQALLRSPRIRLSALLYLSMHLPSEREEITEYLPQKNLLINSLIAAMNGNNPEVQRATVLILQNHFPVLSPSEIFSDNERIIIVENALKLLKSQHEELVWKWLFTDQSHKDFEKIKQRALKKLFEVEPKKIEESVLPMEILKKILEKSKCYEFLQPVIVPMLSYANKYNDSQFAEIINSTIQTILTNFGDFKREIWKALQSSLAEELQDDIASTIEVSKFYLSSFRNPEDDVASSLLLISLLMGIRSLTRSLGPALELIQMMVNRLPAYVPELANAIKSYHLFFASISNDPSKAEHLKLSASLLLSLENHIDQASDKDWIKCLLEAMHNPNTEVALTGVENIIQLLKNSGYKDKLEIDSESDIIVDVFERLWLIVEDAVHKKRAVELILKIEEHDNLKFMELLKKKLIGEAKPRRTIEGRVSKESIDGGQDLTMREIKKSLRIFTEFWKCTGEGVFIVLDYLENPSPEIRQLAREWVIEALDKFECVLDPILEILLNVYTEKKGDTFVFQQIYDSRITLDAFKKLKKLIRNGGEMVVTKANSLKVVPHMKDMLKVNQCEEVSNYIEIMLEVALLYIRTDTTDETFKKENHTVQAAAAEFLDLTLSQGSTQLAYKAVNRVLLSLKKSIDKDDGVLQLLLLNILRVIFFECKIIAEVNPYKQLVGSEEFSQVYLGVLKNKDSYILSHWINFIVESLSMVVHFLRSAVRQEYYSNLIRSFCEEVKNASEKATLFKGLKVVLHQALEIGESPEFTKTLISSSPDKRINDKSSGWIRSFFGTDEPSLDPKDLERSEVLKNLENVVETCLFCIDAFKFEVEVTSRGVGPFSPHQHSKLSHPCLEILNPVMEKFPNEFVRALIEIWKANVVMNERNAQKLVYLILSLNFNGKTFLQALNFYTDTIKFNKKKVPENVTDVISLCHFVLSVFSCITNDSVVSAPEDRKSFWVEACKWLNKIEAVPISLTILWLMEILNLLLVRINIEEELRDKNIKKAVQEVAQKVINKIISNSFEQSQEQIAIPFPPCLYNCENSTQMPLSLASLLTLKSGLYKIVNTLWQADARERGIALIQSPANQVLAALRGKSASLDVDLMSELMSSLICSDPRLAEAFRKDVMDFITQTEFFESMRNKKNCFKNWCKIVNSISNTCYPDKKVIVTEILSRDTAGVFTSQQAQNIQRSKVLKALSFVIYAGEKDVYQIATEDISKTLIGFLKSDRNLNPLVLFTVRILLLKLSHTALSNIWPQLWPHILTELMQMMNEDNLAFKYHAVKFLDLISAINSEEFLMYQWLFFYDSMNNSIFNNVEEFPLVNKMINNYIPSGPVKNTTGVVKRKLVIKKLPATDSEMMKKIEKLCNKVVETNSLRCVPDEESIGKVIEEDFFTLKLGTS